MKRIAIDVSNCQKVDDLYDVLLPALGAPAWHGRNLDALWDSIISDINDVMPPYCMEVSGADLVPAQVASVLARIQGVCEDARNLESLAISFKII